MLASAAAFGLSIFERLTPEGFTTRKIRQARAGAQPPMAGTIADCEVDEEKSVLTKRVRREQEEKDLRELRLISTLIPSQIIQGWAAAASQEYDLVHEAQQQRRFHARWLQDPIIRVPRVLDVSNAGGLRMEYVPWPRFADSPLELGRAAIPHIFRFLIGSIVSDNVVHGDISPNNVLLEPGGQGGVCVVDFGLTSNAPCLPAPTKEPALTISDAWRTPGFCFTEEWWSAHTWLDPQGDSDVDGCFVRSLLSLTHMACLCDYIAEDGHAQLLDEIETNRERGILSRSAGA